MSSESEVLRYGANSITGYVGDVKHVEITPHGIALLPADSEGTVAVGGAYPASTTTYKMWRVGNIRYLSIAPIPVSASSLAGGVIEVGPWAAQDRPATSVITVCAIQSGTKWGPGIGRFTSDGKMTFSPGAVDASLGVAYTDSSTAILKFGAVTGGVPSAVMFVYCVPTNRAVQGSAV